MIYNFMKYVFIKMLMLVCKDTAAEWRDDPDRGGEDHHRARAEATRAAEDIRPEQLLAAHGAADQQPRLLQHLLHQPERHQVPEK